MTVCWGFSAGTFSHSNPINAALIWVAITISTAPRRAGDGVRREGPASYRCYRLKCNICFHV